MNWKAYWKKAWLPLVAVAVIGAGTALFTGAMQTARDDENARQVMLERNTAPVPAATEEPQNINLQAASVQDRYNVFDVLDEKSPLPPENVLNYKEAAAIAVGYVENIFGIRVENCNVFTHYYQYEGMQEAVYLVSIDGEDEESCKYACSVTPLGGALRSARAMPAKNAGASSGTADTKLMKKAADDPAVPEIARKLIVDHFLGKRVIEEILVDGVQWMFGVYGQPDFDVQLDCKVHVDSGDCYTVSVAYPSMSILSVDAYPLGWEACLWGYRTAEQMAEESGGWKMAEGIEQGTETPRPTPAPTPN